MSITDKLEAALPANDDDNGPVTLPASVVREAVAWMGHMSDDRRWWRDFATELQLELSDQQNARWLAWSLAVIGVGVVGLVVGAGL